MHLTIEWENQLVALKSKISLLEAQLVSERERTKRLQEERDEAVRATAQAINESEGIKSENRALKAEIANLRKQFQENTKPTQSQKPTTARERIKERVDVERRKDHARKVRGQRDAEGAGDRSFIQVFTFNSQANSSPTRSRSCVMRLESSEKRTANKAILKRSIPKQKSHRVRLSISKQKTLKEMFKCTLTISS